MSTGLEIIGIVLLSQVWAPLRALNLPSIRPLKVNSVTHRPRGMYPDDWGVFMHGHSFEHFEYEETPEMLIIRGTVRRDQNWTISIDLEDTTFGHIDEGDLTFYEYGGSGELGLYFFGIPALLLTSPLWLATNLFRVLVGFTTRCDLDMWFVWFKLFWQLKTEDRRTLWRALRRYCRGIESGYNLRKAAEYQYELDEYYKDQRSRKNDERH